MVTVYTPAAAYACENVVVWVNARASAATPAEGEVYDASSPQRTEYESVPFSGSFTPTIHVPVAPTASVVGPEKFEITGGRFLVVPSNHAVQYGFVILSGVHAIRVHIAGEVGVSREQELHPSDHALHLGLLAGSG